MKMKKAVSLFFLLFALAGSQAQVKISNGITFPEKFDVIKPEERAPSLPEWKLVFEDDFNDSVPDKGKWLFTPPWGSVFTFSDPHRSDSSQNGTAETFDPRNISIRNGIAKLWIKQEETVSRSSYDKADSVVQPDGLPVTRLFHYSSGCLYSKQDFGPGKFEIRCKIPKVDGVWPAFWLFGACAEEFDVFEFVNGKFSDGTDECNKRLQMTYHRYADCNDPKTWCSHGTAVLDTIDYSKDFHTYSVEWSEYQVTWKVDGKVEKVTYGLKRMHLNRPVDERKIRPGKKYRLYKVMPIPGVKVSIIVSCGVTNYGNAKHPLTRGTYPAVFEVDYVKVWTKQ